MTEIHAFDPDGTPSPGAEAGVSAIMATTLDPQVASYVQGTTATRAALDQRYSIVVKPEEYGAVGDGVTDDSQAFMDMTAAVNTAGSAVIELRAGAVYHFGRYRVSGNGVSHMSHRDVEGIRIVGNGAKIDAKGDFTRSATNAGEPLLWLRFYNCTGVTIENLEVDGNVDQMSREGTYGTSPLHAGVYLEGCEDVALHNVNVHHWFNDGIFVTANVTPDAVTGKRRASKNVLLQNVRATNSGRNNMSILYARGLTAVNSFFDGAGETDGYGEHNPVAGVDIEPESPDTRDEYTGDITFINCRWRWNKGGAMIATGPTATDNVSLIGGEVIIPPGEPQRLGFMMRVKQGSCQGVRFEMADRTVSVATGAATDNDATLTYRSCTFVGDSNLYQDSSTGNAVLIEDCDFIVRPTAPTTVRAPYISNSLTVFRGNRVFIPAQVYAGGAGSQIVNNLVAQLSENNMFSTDLAADAAGYFISAYGSTHVRGDRYLSGDRFREANASVWQNPMPVSRGAQGVGDEAWLGAGASRRRLTYRSSAPTSGEWNRGDRCYNTFPGAGGAEGWVCVGSGTPGVWKEFGAIAA